MTIRLKTGTSYPIELLSEDYVVQPSLLNELEVTLCDVNGERIAEAYRMSERDYQITKIYEEVTS